MQDSIETNMLKIQKRKMELASCVPLALLPVRPRERKGVSADLASSLAG